MRQLTALVTLILVSCGASGSDDFTRARELGIDIISAELSGGFCAPAPIPADKRTELSLVLAQISQVGLTDPTGLNPLSLAVLADDVPALIRLSRLGYSLENSAPVLLHDAALHNSSLSLSYLLSRGLDPNGPNAYGATALMTAAANGRHEVAQTLLTAGASPNARNKDGGTALHYAIGCRDLAMVQALLASGAEVDPSAVALAEKHGLSLEQPER
jgi:hypothetical protein